MKGFTLIELLVVVLIIGILSAVALPQYTKAVDKARLSQVLVTMDALHKGVDAYMLANGIVTISSSDLIEALDIDVSKSITCQNAYCTSALKGGWSITWSCFGTAGQGYFIYATVFKTGTAGNILLQNNFLGGKWVRWCGSYGSSTGKTFCESLKSNGYTVTIQ